MTEPRVRGRGFAPARPIIVGLLFVALSATGSYAALVVTGPGPAATPMSGSPVPTSATEGSSPSATATVRSAATPGVTPYVWNSADVERLMLQVPATLSSSCTILQPTTTDPSRAVAAIAAVTCQPAGSGRQVTYERLPDGPSTQSAYQARVAASRVTAASGGCWDGHSGEVDYSYGRALCWIDAAVGVTRVVWTDERAATIASASGSSGDLQALVDWWWNAARLRPETAASGLTADQQDLLNAIQPWLRPSCQAYDASTDRTALDPVGDLGSIDCRPSDPLLEDVGWFRFTTPAALHAWYARRIALIGFAEDVGGCYDGNPGETTWPSGRVTCYLRSSGHAAIRWINDGSLTYGALNAKNSDLASLFSWWQGSGTP